MRKIIASAVVIMAMWGIIGCRQGNDEPAPRMSEEKFKNVLTDILILKEVNERFGDFRDSLDLNLMQSIWRRHHTDSLSFYTTLAYYSAHPEELLEIYREADERIKKKMDSLNARYKVPPPRPAKLPAFKEKQPVR